MISFSKLTHPPNHPRRKSLKINSELAKLWLKLSFDLVDRLINIGLVFNTPKPFPEGKHKSQLKINLILVRAELKSGPAKPQLVMHIFKILA